MFNPRFPHQFRVWRSRVEDGIPVTDDNGDAVIEVVHLDAVAMLDSLPVVQSDGTFATEKVEWMSFGYRTQGKNTKDTTDVIVSDYKLATPMFLTHLRVGDRVEVRDYERTYWGEVVKKMTFNLGSNVWINEVRN